MSGSQRWQTADAILFFLDAILNSVIHREPGLVEREWTQEMDSRLGSTTNFPWDRCGTGALSLSLEPRLHKSGEDLATPALKRQAITMHLCYAADGTRRHVLCSVDTSLPKGTQHPSSRTFLGVWAEPRFKMKTAPPRK